MGFRCHVISCGVGGRKDGKVNATATATIIEDKEQPKTKKEEEKRRKKTRSI